MDFQLKRGINVQPSRGSMDDPVLDIKYKTIIKNAGFDHIRLAISGNILEEGGEQYWERVKLLCGEFLESGLIPILDVHGFHEINCEPLLYKESFLDFWEKLAAFMADLDPRVIFEILNEPDGALDFKLLNNIQNEAIARIRKTNPTRLIAAAVGHCNTIERLHHLKLPESDPNIFVTIHDYTPMDFTHQGATWTKDFGATGIFWGTQEEMDYMYARYDLVVAWAKLNKRFIHLGEFGVFSKAEMPERIKWTSFVARLCESKGIAWSYWEFWDGFGAYNKQNDCWRPELLNALIPEAKAD